MDQVIDILKQKNYVVSSILLSKYRKMNITEKELIFLIFVLNDNLLFNAKKIAEKLGWKMPEVLETIESLTSKDLIKIEVKKDKQICEEYLNIDNLFNALSFQIIGKKEEKKEPIDLFESFESEFGRPLSPIEMEIIRGWLENDFSEELIIQALKEAIYNGVFRLNYIDKILFEWKKKGIKNKKDVEKNNREFNERKKTTEEVFEYDWLNE